ARGRADAVSDRFGVVAGLEEALADPAEQEDVVVHGHPEEDAEEEERHPGDNRVDVPEAEQARAEALLEHEYEQSVGGADREQVEQDRLRGDDERAEGDQEQSEAEREDEREDAR